MQPLNWIKALPWVIIAILCLLLLGVSKAYLSERDELTSLKAGIEVLAKQAQDKLNQAEIDNEALIKTVKDQYETKLPEIKDMAVANYLAAHPTLRVRKPIACSGSLPANAVSNQVDDDPKPELVLDETTIGRCAEDALRSEAWQTYCLKHECPIVD